MREETTLTCIGCNKEMPEESMINGRATWFGLYKNAELLEFVCTLCYDTGVRTGDGKRKD